MNTPQTTESSDTSEPTEQEKIAGIAYLIWLGEGCPEGCAEEHWRQAELLHATHGEPASLPQCVA